MDPDAEMADAQAVAGEMGVVAEQVDAGPPVEFPDPGPVPPVPAVVAAQLPQPDADAAPIAENQPPQVADPVAAQLPPPPAPPHQAAPPDLDAEFLDARETIADLGDVSDLAREGESVAIPQGIELEAIEPSPPAPEELDAPPDRPGEVLPDLPADAAARKAPAARPADGPAEPLRRHPYSSFIRFGRRRSQDGRPAQGSPRPPAEAEVEEDFDTFSRLKQSVKDVDRRPQDTAGGLPFDEVERETFPDDTQGQNAQQRMTEFIEQVRLFQSELLGALGKVGDILDETRYELAQIRNRLERERH